MTQVLNETKLRPPLWKADLVERPRLIERICRHDKPLLTVITAAAGFGKTSLLIQLYRHLQTNNIQSSWLSLDDFDNDYVRFLFYLSSAIQGQYPAGKNQIKLLVTGKQRPPLTTVADMLLNTVANTNKELVICLDDFHKVTDNEIGQLISSLLLNHNSRLRWVISSRSIPSQLPLSRLRVLNELIEINSADLQFSTEESKQFFDRTAGLQLDPKQIELLNKRTEGWVAGLQMASISMQKSEVISDFIKRFTGEHHGISSFLSDEVLTHIDQEDKHFLLETSFLPMLNTELCNYVTSRSDARSRLDHLEKLNLFIFSLDDKNTWYRYHHLFAEFLLKRLREFEPDKINTLRQRASEWFEHNNMSMEAVEQAMAAGLYDRAAMLLNSISAELSASGQIRIMENLAARLPDKILDNYPDLQLDRIWAWEIAWEFDKARIYLDRVNRKLEEYEGKIGTLPGITDPEYVLAKLAHRELMYAFLTDDFHATERLCESWIAAPHPPDLYMETSTASALMFARRGQYRCEGSCAKASAFHEIFVKHQSIAANIFNDTVDGMIHHLLAETTEAEESYRLALEGAMSFQNKKSRMAAGPALLLAELYYQQNRLEEAEELVEEYLYFAHGKGFVDMLIAGYITKARLEFNDQLYDSALQTLAAGERHSIITGFERLRVHIIAERFRQFLLAGKREELLRSAREENLLGSCTKLEPGPGITIKEEFQALAWARAAVAHDDIDGAIRLLKKWFTFTHTRHCHLASHRLALDLTSYLYLRGDNLAARKYCRSALQTGHQGKFVRTFLDAGETVRLVLEQLDIETELADLEVQNYTREIGQILQTEPAFHDILAFQYNNVAPDHAGLEFSQRELDILELAADDVSNKAIADRLALAESTVKWYWQQIFNKLGVRRRLQAVNIARAAGVIH